MGSLPGIRGLREREVFEEENMVSTPCCYFPCLSVFSDQDQMLKSAWLSASTYPPPLALQTAGVNPETASVTLMRGSQPSGGVPSPTRPAKSRTPGKQALRDAGSFPLLSFPGKQADWLDLGRHIVWWKKT